MRHAKIMLGLITLRSRLGYSQEMTMDISRMDERGVLRRPMSKENKAGLALVLFALLAFGGYSLMFFVGFLGDILN